MSVRKRSHKWHYRFTVNGETYTGSTGLADTRQNEGRAKEIEACERLAAGDRRVRPESPRFEKAAGEFLSWCRTTAYRSHPSSASRMRGSFASLVPFFSGLAVDAIGATDIERYKTWRIGEHGVQDVTLRNDLNALSVFFGYAERAGWSGENPFFGPRKVKRPGGEAKRFHIITPEEEEAYFKVATGDAADILKLILLQGPRPAEVRCLRRANYDAKRATIEIERSKSEAGRRTLHLCGEAVRIVEKRLRECPASSRWLFPSRRVKNRDAHIGKLNETHNRICRLAGVSFDIYDGRHTFATRMLVEAGVDCVTLARIMGHADDGVTLLRKYVHPTADHEREAMRKFESAKPAPRLLKVKG